MGAKTAGRPQSKQNVITSDLYPIIFCTLIGQDYLKARNSNVFEHFSTFNVSNCGFLNHKSQVILLLCYVKVFKKSYMGK